MICVLDRKREMKEGRLPSIMVSSAIPFEAFPIDVLFHYKESHALFHYKESHALFRPFFLFYTIYLLKFSRPPPTKDVDKMLEN